MKIMLDLPESTLCASVTIVFMKNGGMFLSNTTIDTDELKNKKEIKIEEEVKHED